MNLEILDYQDVALSSFYRVLCFRCMIFTSFVWQTLTFILDSLMENVLGDVSEETLVMLCITEAGTVRQLFKLLSHIEERQLLGICEIHLHINLLKPITCSEANRIFLGGAGLS